MAVGGDAPTVTTLFASAKRGAWAVPSKRRAMSAVIEAEEMSGKADAVAAETVAKVATTALSAPTSSSGYRGCGSGASALPTGRTMETPSKA